MRPCDPREARGSTTTTGGSRRFQVAVPTLTLKTSWGVPWTMSENVRVEVKDAVATLTLDRPEALNALNHEVMEELATGLDEAVKSGARVLVVTGEGKAFVAGADVGEMRTMDPGDARAHAQAGHELIRAIEDLHIPTVAGVNGFALGGGLELALACDIRVASSKAVFGLPEVTLGVIPGFGGTQRLSRLIGLGPALDLVLTGRKIDAEEALRLGLVSQVVEPEELMGRVYETAEALARNGPVAVQLAKKVTRQGFDGSLKSGDAMEAEAFAACFGTEDQKEGMAAFLEKREAEFEGK